MRVVSLIGKRSMGGDGGPKSSESIVSVEDVVEDGSITQGIRWIQKHPLLFMASWVLSKVWVVDKAADLHSSESPHISSESPHISSPEPSSGVIKEKRSLRKRRWNDEHEKSLTEMYDQDDYEQEMKKLADECLPRGPLPQLRAPKPRSTASKTPTPDWGFFTSLTPPDKL
eukprot:295240_1